MVLGFLQRALEGSAALEVVGQILTPREIEQTLGVAHRERRLCAIAGELTVEDQAVIDTVEAGFAAVGEHIEAARFKAALGEAMQLARRVNIYVNDQAPWALLESDRDRAATVLYTCLRCVNDLKTMFMDSRV